MVDDGKNGAVSAGDGVMVADGVGSIGVGSTTSGGVGVIIGTGVGVGVTEGTAEGVVVNSGKITGDGWMLTDGLAVIVVSPDSLAIVFPSF